MSLHLFPAAPPVSPAPRVRATKGGRFYDITEPDGTVVSYPSVTTVLDVIAKPALVGWAAKEERLAVSQTAADFYIETAKHAQFHRTSYLLALERRLGPELAHVAVRDQAAAVGTQVHAHIEWALRGQHGPAPVLTTPATTAVRAWQAFAREVSLTPQRTETMVYSRSHRYAGTLDLIATLDAAALLRLLQRQGGVAPAVAAWLATRPTVTALVDWKTGKAVYREAHLQSVAYQRAWLEMGHRRVDGGLIVRLPKDQYDRKGLEVTVVPPTGQLYPTFLAVRQLWDWHAAPEARRQTGVRQMEGA